MISRLDVAELKNNIANPENCSIRRMAGAYIKVDEGIVLRFQEDFQTLDDSEFFKYLKLVKDLFQPKAMEDKDLELCFTSVGGMETDFKALAEDELQAKPYLEAVYQGIQDSYKTEDNYLILLFYGKFDVMVKTSDGNELDESEEVFTYVLGAICPVKVDKAALKYDEMKQSICPKILQHVVQPPAAGFVWPAFEQRKTNTGKLLFYCKHPAKPPHRLMEDFLHCHRTHTATEHRESFEHMIFKATYNQGGDEYGEKVQGKVNMTFRTLLESEEYFGDPEKDKRINDLELQDILVKQGVKEIVVQGLVKDFHKTYAATEWPKVKWLYNSKLAAWASAQAQREKIRSLLARGRDMAAAAGNQDLAGEITDYLEGTR